MKKETGNIDKKKEEKIPTAAAAAAIIAAGCLWGTMGLWVRKFSGSGLDSMQILALRVGVTAVLMGLFLFIYNRKLLKIRWKDLWCFLGTGICSVVFFGYCYNRTILLTSLSVAAILLYTAPIFVMVLSRFLFGERFTGRKVAALLLAFAGCICVTGLVNGQNAVSTAGIITGLGSGFGYALYSVFSRFALERRYHPLTITFYTFLCALAAVLILADLQPIGLFLTETPGNFLYGVAYGSLTTVLPYILYTWGLSFVENSRASIMATIEPVVATLLGVFLLGEPMTLMNGAGVIMVLVALSLLR